MEQRVEQLFSTPLWTFYLDIDNDKLTQEGINQVGNTNYFDCPGDTIKQLRANVMEALQEPMKKFPGPPFSSLPSLSARQKVIPPKGKDTPHHHPNAMLVGVYYVSVPKDSGDILLHDPRGAISGKYLWGYYENSNEEYAGPRPFYRVRPKEGMLIIFPAYLVHSVESNVSDEVRRSIIISLG